MWDKDMSDEMKVIMESWRSWGLTQKMFGDKFKLDPRNKFENLVAWLQHRHLRKTSLIGDALDLDNIACCPV